MKLYIAFKDSDITTRKLREVNIKLVEIHEYFDVYFNDSKSICLVKFKDLRETWPLRFSIVMVVWFVNIINSFRNIRSKK